MFLDAGFFVFYIIERVVMVHTCGEGECECECELGNISWVSLLGISTDNSIDGFAIAIGYLNDPLLGLFITLAVIVHEIPQGLATTAVMKDFGCFTKAIFSILSIGAILHPLGSLVSNLFEPSLREPIIALVAGEFICLRVGELRPEAHRKFNIGVILTVIMGAVMTLILELLL